VSAPRERLIIVLPISIVLRAFLCSLIIKFASIHKYCLSPFSVYQNRYRCASTMQAMVAFYGLLSLGLVVLAILAGATFINDLLKTVHKFLTYFKRRTSKDV